MKPVPPPGGYPTPTPAMELWTFLTDEVKGLEPEQVAVLGRTLKSGEAWGQLPAWLQALLADWADIWAAEE